eukprot:CFRG4140T1
MMKPMITAEQTLVRSKVNYKRQGPRKLSNGANSKHAALQMRLPKGVKNDMIRKASPAAAESIMKVKSREDFGEEKQETKAVMKPVESRGCWEMYKGMALLYAVHCYNMLLQRGYTPFIYVPVSHDISDAMFTFGISLAGATAVRETPDESCPYKIPKIVYLLCNALEPHTQVKGIFRLAGNQKRISMMIEDITNSYETVDEYFFKNRNPHDIVSVLKYFLNTLPEPLIHEKEVVAFVRALSNRDEKERLTEFNYILMMMPREHLHTLMYIIQLLRQVSAKASVNEMHANNVAVCLSTRMGIEPDELKPKMKWMDDMRQILEYMILNEKIGRVEWNSVIDELAHMNKGKRDVFMKDWNSAMADAMTRMKKKTGEIKVERTERTERTEREEKKYPTIINRTESALDIQASLGILGRMKNAITSMSRSSSKTSIVDVPLQEQPERPAVVTSPVPYCGPRPQRTASALLHDSLCESEKSTGKAEEDSKAAQFDASSTTSRTPRSPFMRLRNSMRTGFSRMGSLSALQADTLDGSCQGIRDESGVSTSDTVAKMAAGTVNSPGSGSVRSRNMRKKALTSTLSESPLPRRQTGSESPSIKRLHGFFAQKRSPMPSPKTGKRVTPKTE